MHLPDESFASIVQHHEIDFGNEEDAVYTPAVTLWMLVSQVFFSGPLQVSNTVALEAQALSITRENNCPDTFTALHGTP